MYTAIRFFFKLAFYPIFVIFFLIFTPLIATICFIDNNDFEDFSNDFKDWFEQIINYWD